MTCAIPRDGKWLILVNGSYGKRMCAIADVHELDYVSKTIAKIRRFRPTKSGQWLEQDPSITAVAVVHCETTTGL